MLHVCSSKACNTAVISNTLIQHLTHNCFNSHCLESLSISFMTIINRYILILHRECHIILEQCLYKTVQLFAIYFILYTLTELLTTSNYCIDRQFSVAVQSMTTEKKILCNLFSKHLNHGMNNASCVGSIRWLLQTTQLNKALQTVISYLTSLKGQRSIRSNQHSYCPSTPCRPGISCGIDSNVPCYHQSITTCRENIRKRETSKVILKIYPKNIL